MTVREKSYFLLVLGLLLLPGCVATQRLTIETDPPGAEVFLLRRGEVEVAGGASGIYGEVDVGTFEEEEFSLGTTPVDYEFDLEDREAVVAGRGAGGEVTRRYIEGTIRIVLRGFETIVRRIRFSGSDIDLALPLQPGRPQ